MTDDSKRPAGDGEPQHPAHSEEPARTTQTPEHGRATPNPEHAAQTKLVAAGPALVGSPTNKTWLNFLLEFGLVFLAVLLGFVADAIFEKIAENKSEKRHMRMLIYDLNDDIYRLDSNSFVRCNREKKLDSLINYLEEKNVGQHAALLYRLVLSVDIYETFFRNDRTIIQFKNAGGMTMVRNDSVSAAIMDYDSYIISEIDWNNNIEAARIDHFKEIRYDLFDAQLLNRVASPDTTLMLDMLNFLPASGASINAIAGTVFQMKRVSRANRECAKTARMKALSLIELIKRQYRLVDVNSHRRIASCYE